VIALRRALDRAIEWFAFGLIGALLVTVMLGVVTRALNDPLIWTDEISRFLMVWLAVFGWLLASRRRAHIRIRFFHDLLPKRAWCVWEIALQAAVALLGVLLAGYSVALVTRNLDMAALTVPIAMAWMYVPMVLAGLLTVAQAIGEIVEHLRQPSPLPAAGDSGLVE
jgi:TRAP-type C4-dicarboxylate transport system permease small subunit